MKHFRTTGRTIQKALIKGTFYSEYRRIPIEELSSVTRTNTTRTHLRARLIHYKILKDECYDCGINV